MSAIMAMDWFFLLAPAALLLLGAFIMHSIAPHLPARLRLYVALSGSILVLPLLANANFRSGSADAPSVLSGWGLGSALTLRADAFSLTFLILIVLLLFVLLLAKGDHLLTSANDRRASLYFMLSGGASLVFVAANGLTVSYALLIFDAIGALFWLTRGHTKAAVLRLLLSIVTTATLTLYGLPTTHPLSHLMLAVAFWLRLGLYPFVEASYVSQWDRGETLLWFSLSTTIGVYLVMRFPIMQPLPEPVFWLVVATMLLNGLIAWLSARHKREAMLIRLLLALMLLTVLVTPVSPLVAAALTLVAVTASAALWLTPRLGRPNLGERNWPWLYAAPTLATLSVLGAPFSLGWFAYSELYAQIITNHPGVLVVAITLAEGFAFAALIYYWRDLLGQGEIDDLASAAGLMATVPFLVPGLSLVTLQALAGQLLDTRFDWSPPVLIAVSAAWLWAALLSYGRGRLMSRLGLSPQRAIDLVSLTWAAHLILLGLDSAARLLLRLRLIIEGEHYLGWATLIALAGILVLLLS